MLKSAILPRAALAAAMLLSGAAFAGDRITEQKPSKPAAIETRAPCQGGKGWTKIIEVEPSDIRYRVKGKALTPGGLKPETFRRILDTHQCLGDSLLNGPQRTSCRVSEKDGEYRCSAGRFLQITKDDDSEWSPAEITKTLARYTKVQCCVALEAETDPAPKAEARSGAGAKPAGVHP